MFDAGLPQRFDVVGTAGLGSDFGAGKRVDLLAVVQHPEMQVREFSRAGLTDLADHIAGFDFWRGVTAMLPCFMWQ